jgi:hypothetical protein
VHSALVLLAGAAVLALVTYPHAQGIIPCVHEGFALRSVGRAGIWEFTPPLDYAALARMRDDKVAAKTGRTWQEWTRVLDGDHLPPCRTATWPGSYT